MVLIGYALKCDDVRTPNIFFAHPGETTMVFAETRVKLLKRDMDESYPGHHREVVALYAEEEIW